MWRIGRRFPAKPKAEIRQRVREVAIRSPANRVSQARFQWTAPEVQKETNGVFTATRAIAPKVDRKAVMEKMLLKRRLNLVVSP